MDNTFNGLADNLKSLSVDLHKNLTGMIKVFDQINEAASDKAENLSEEDREKMRNFVKGAGLEDIFKAAQEKAKK